MFCKNSGAGVSLFLGIAPVALIAGQIKLNLAFLELRLLQAEKVCVQAVENIFKAFFLYCPQAVYVP